MNSGLFYCMLQGACETLNRPLFFFLMGCQQGKALLVSFGDTRLVQTRYCEAQPGYATTFIKKMRNLCDYICSRGNFITSSPL